MKSIFPYHFPPLAISLSVLSSSSFNCAFLAFFRRRPASAAETGRNFFGQTTNMSLQQSERKRGARGGGRERGEGESAVKQTVRTKAVGVGWG